MECATVKGSVRIHLLPACSLPLDSVGSDQHWLLEKIMQRENSAHGRRQCAGDRDITAIGDVQVVPDLVGPHLCLEGISNLGCGSGKLDPATAACDLAHDESLPLKPILD